MSANERAIAIRESHEIVHADAYFAGRQQVDCPLFRKIFEAGFRRAWGEHEVLRREAKALLEFEQSSGGPVITGQLEDALKGLA